MGEYISFRQWLYQIVKESFRTLVLENLKEHEVILKKIFERITLKDETGNTRYDNRYDHDSIRSLIRRAFVPKRDFSVKEEIVPCEASLLQIERLVSPVFVQDDKPFFHPKKMSKRLSIGTPMHRTRFCRLKNWH